MLEENNYPGNVEMDEGLSIPSKKKGKVVFEQSAVTPEQMFLLVYKYNKSFEFHYRNEVIRFEGGKVVFPQKYLEGFPEEVINSDEFKLQSDNFVIKKIGV